MPGPATASPSQLQQKATILVSDRVWEEAEDMSEVLSRVSQENEPGPELDVGDIGNLGNLGDLGDLGDLGGLGDEPEKPEEEEGEGDESEH